MYALGNLSGLTLIEFEGPGVWPQELQQSSAALQSNTKHSASNSDSIQFAHKSAISIRLDGTACFCSTWHEGWDSNPLETFSDMSGS